MASIDVSRYARSPVHKAIVMRDYAGLKKILSGLPRLCNPAEIHTESASLAEEEKADAIAAVIDRRDVPNRDTPLHLAVKLGDGTTTEMLMVAGADWSLQNEQGWSALQEAICNREEAIAMAIVRHYQPLAWAKWCRRLPRLVGTMRRMRDFYMEITFHFESSVIPFISRIAPSDTYKIWKRGANLRADMTLAGFDGFRIQRSDQTVLFLGEGSEDGKVPPGSLCMISHKDREVMNALDGAGAPASDEEVKQEVAAMSQTNIFRPGIDVTQAVLLPQTTWRQQEKTEKVGSWKAKVYDMHNVVVSIKSRKVPGAMTDDEFLTSCNGNETESEELDGILTEDERRQLEVALKLDSSEMTSENGDGTIAHRHSFYEQRDIPIEDLNGCRNGETKQEKKGWFGDRRKRDSKLDAQKRIAPPRNSLCVEEKVSDLLGDSPSRSQSKPGRYSVDVVARGDEHRRAKDIKSPSGNSNRHKEGGRENEFKKGLRPILWLSPNFPLQTEELLPEKMGGSSETKLLQELILYAASAALSCLVLFAGLRHLDPNREASKKAIEHKKEIAKRLGRPLIQTTPYEDVVACDVINPDHINVEFDSIGGLESIKQALYELVILPLRRPELFSHGKLLGPQKGVLLYGPPGTGKTMLAKAIAKESGAVFINVRISNLMSKWFGDAQKLVAAVFSLAHKLQPAIIFIDEVDSFLGQRKTTDHEALTNMKTEFMALWDGFTTDHHARVMVLAATNRPSELDEAILRRLPQAFEIGIPDRRERAEILKVILRGENYDENIDFDHVARLCEGYTGSDLLELCKKAAYFPIRELLDEEKKNGKSSDAPRPLSQKDLERVLATSRKTKVAASEYSMSQSGLMRPSQPDDYPVQAAINELSRLMFNQIANLQSADTQPDSQEDS